jgi:ribonuclease HII
MTFHIVGIDEAGRGPLAGPVAVGAVRMKKGGEKALLGIKDSKKLSEGARLSWFKIAEEAKRSGEIDFAVSLVSERMIDKKGISFAINLGIKRCLDKLRAKESDIVFLDGSLHAPEEFVHQETIIKGDEKVAVISLASICAKVTRDRYMQRMSKKYPEYGFEIHKGYGTKRHMDAINKYGKKDIHRLSFITRR